MVLLEILLFADSFSVSMNRRQCRLKDVYANLWRITVHFLQLLRDKPHEKEEEEGLRDIKEGEEEERGGGRGRGGGLGRGGGRGRGGGGGDEEYLPGLLTPYSHRVWSASE
jgi:hypothetical protein